MTLARTLALTDSCGGHGHWSGRVPLVQIESGGSHMLGADSVTTTLTHPHCRCQKQVSGSLDDVSGLE